MALTALTLTDFRNHRATTLAGMARFNLLVGANGAGKTNILEAISLLAPGRGLRRATLADMAGQTGPGGFTVAARLAIPTADTADADPLHLGTGTLADAPSRRRVRINGADTTALALADWLSLFWLTPAMDRIFMEGPGARRRLLDRMVLALSPPHAAHATLAETALRERNRLLALPDAPDPRWLDAVEAQLAEAGAEVSRARAALVERLDATLASLPPSPFARPRLAYLPGGPNAAQALAEALATSRRACRAARRSLVGPHRDELRVHHADKNQPASECSTGEQKAMLIALTLAHAQLAADPDTSGATPRPRLLLLDEVAAHLDPLRRAALTERLADTGAQIWMTGTEAAPFVEPLAPHAADTAMWAVSDGAVSPASL